MNLPILVRDEVWKNLKFTDLSFAEEVRQCINKIENRQFDFGLRVKKLKGVSRIVWEARINRASRLLFTYRQSNHSNGQIQKFIAIEAVCIEHDEVSHQAKIIDRNWWEVEEIKVLGNLEQDFNHLSSEDQKEIRLWETESIEIQAELTDELLENIKWLILEPEIIKSDEEWQNAIESGADLRLRLTPDESKAIDTYGNILLSGSAGTGKTTVGLYRLARTLQMNPAATCLYVAYNPILVKESEEQFKQLWGGSFESLPLKLDFLTIRNLCLKITKDYGEEFERRLVGYPDFYQRYIKKPERKKYPPFLLWDEIRSVIKGANLKEKSLLSEREYQELGKKRSEVFTRENRHEIHKLARWYQDYLDCEQLADEIDLTRATLGLTKTPQSKPYTLIVCDEVQDFTEIQLELLIRLLARDVQILCAGDINQMISPSGFRWEDLTTRLYKKDLTWTKENLPVNFRSTGKLVSLAVNLLKLKFQLLSESQPHEEVPANTSGELARLVEASKDDLKQINLGAADAILVRTEQRKQELAQALTTNLIFTIEESKGLEFDTVYLIDFFENSKSLWSTALGLSKKLNERQKPELRLEFNLLYVAITRARRLLNICEVEISDLWKRSEIAKSLIPMNIDKAFNQAQSVDAQDWYKRAMYYRDARLLAQALECATKSGDETLIKEIKVESLLLEQKYDEAAQLLLEIKKYSEAAEILENLADWKEAIQAWNKAGNQLKSLECKVRYLKDKNQLEDAANILIDLGRSKEAAEILESGKYWDKAAELWAKSGNKEHQEQCLFQCSIRKNKALPEQLKCEAVPSIVFTDEFTSSVNLLKKANLNKFNLEEIIEVFNGVHSSELMKSIAVNNNMSLSEYCVMLLSSWLDKVPDDVIIPDNQMLHIVVDCNTFEVLPVLVLSKSKLKELLPEFSGEIKAGANVMMELAYTEEDAMLFAMHLNLPNNIINKSSTKSKLVDKKDNLELKILDLNSCYYTTPSDLENVSLTISEWQKKINEETLRANYSKIFYSKYAKNHSIDREQLSLKIYLDQIYTIYQDFNEYLSQVFSPDLRCLKDKDGTIYCIVAVRKKIVSHPYLSQFNRKIPWLEYIFVDPKLLNQGIGKLTFQYLIAEFGNEIASQIYFYSTSFFEKQGFELVLDTQLDADFYIAKNLHSSFRTYEVQVLIPESEFCHKVLSISCSLNQSIKFTLYNIMIEHTNCSSVQLKDLESNKLYLMEANGKFEIFSLEMEGDEFPLILKDDFNRADFFMNDIGVSI